MTIELVNDEKIAETSSKGNQEKWYNKETNRWYKLDQFGYESLAETVISRLLEQSNLETDFPFAFIRYSMERLRVHGRERTGCSSKNFLQPGQSLITVDRLLSSYLGYSLKKKLAHLSSHKKRMVYLAEETAAITGLKLFPQYLTLLFELDALFCNDDRHLNNIAVIEQDGTFHYCPVFDNGAGLLSNTQLLQMDVSPTALISSLRARPFLTTFTRQRDSARSFYGAQLKLPKLTEREIQNVAAPLLEYYPARDHSLIADRMTACILSGQK